MTGYLVIVFAAVLAAYYLFEIGEKARRGHAAIDSWYGEGWRRDLLHVLLALSLVSVGASVCGHLYLSVTAHFETVELQSA